MMEKAGPDTCVCASEEELVEAALIWKPGDPFPLLPGNSLTRFLSLDDGALPAVARTPRVGSVVSTGGEVGRACGRLLAVATERPHTHVPVGEVVRTVAERNGPVAVVALAGELEDAGDWPGARNPMAGVVSARTPASLVCLVYRTLVPQHRSSPGAFVVTNSFHSDDLSADAVEMDELDALYRTRHQLVTYHLHGRECSVGLPDGVICGRTDDGAGFLGLPSPPGTATAPGPLVPERPLPADSRIPSCLRGEGCFRADLEVGQRIPAADLHAVLVFSQSCGAVSAGVSPYPEAVGIGGGFLEGTAVAVIGGMGSHNAEPGAERLLDRGLRAGLPLGEVVAEMNSGRDGERGGLAVFGLAGDPGLVLPYTGDPPEAAEAATAASALERLHHLHDSVLPGCERLAWLEVDLDEEPLRAARTRVRALADEPDRPGLGEDVSVLEDEIAVVQQELVARTAAMIQRDGADFLGDASPAFQRMSRRDAPCTSCGTDRGQHLVLRHAVEHRLTVQTLQCRRCGDVWWSTEEGEPTLSIGGRVDTDADRAAPGTLTRPVTNTGDRTVRGAVGMAFRAFYDPPVLPVWHSEAVTIPPGGSHTFTASLTPPAPGARPDVHSGFVIALLDGVYLMSPVILRLS
ncbi:hypothetical protein ACH4RG_36260 [Streptomyces sp. NPDC021019]|uniref:hypothetical protein n=1 Tax=Streptomyces sp. NPDC021019 TaxID=3365108 RepID=UPI0037B59739